MNARKIEGLLQMAKRGGTVAEKERAKHALVNGGLIHSHMGDTGLATTVETGEDVVTAQGVITLTRDGFRSYLRQSSLTYFLSHISEGEKFNARTVGTNVDFGSHEFYTILRWLKSIRAVVKTAGGYVIKSVQFVKDAWNRLVKEHMFV